MRACASNEKAVTRHMGLNYGKDDISIKKNNEGNCKTKMLLQSAISQLLIKLMISYPNPYRRSLKLYAIKYFSEDLYIKDQVALHNGGPNDAIIESGNLSVLSVQCLLSSSS